MEKISNTKKVVVIRGYLLREIEYMKSSKSKRNDNILFYNEKKDDKYRDKGIYDVLDIIYLKEIDPKSYADKSLKIRQHIKKILDYWKSIAYIKGHSFDKNISSTENVSIIL